MPKQPILLTDEIVPPPALWARIITGTVSWSARTKASAPAARFIEFFTATIRNRNTRMAYARAVKQFFDWCDERRLQLTDRSH